ncbi:hypothetical protein JVU11DRAFT_7893 [Chiua virens]|nr:hypothetical protein JVU11DRAFT_7893 [Chiua virens]
MVGRPQNSQASLRLAVQLRKRRALKRSASAPPNFPGTATPVARDQAEESDSNHDETNLDSDHRDIATPRSTVAGLSSRAARSPLTFPETPMAVGPFDPGSVIRTPTKRRRPLQPSPQRIGNKRGVRGVQFKEDDVPVRWERRRTSPFSAVESRRIVHKPPVGANLNMTRYQVEASQLRKERKIVQIQSHRLYADEQRVLEEEGKWEAYSGFTWPARLANLKVEFEQKIADLSWGRTSANETHRSQCHIC